MTLPNINFDKKRIIAYIDVMGFKSMLSNTPSNIEKLNHYFSIIQGVRGYQELEKKTDIQFMAVSDSIVFSSELDNDWDEQEKLNFISYFLKEITNTQLTFMQNGIWVRGAISIGDLYMLPEKSILVGQAFVDVYNLEKLADYPRIIIDSKVLSYLGLAAPEFIKKVKLECKTPILNYSCIPSISSPADDYIQLDWFGYALELIKTKDLESLNLKIKNSRILLDVFFKNIYERQNINLDVFKKNQKLIAYLLRSSLERHTEDKNHTSPNYDYISQEIRKLSGHAPFNTKK